jgi:ABC-type Fe3+-siderophore transport system permease subunit
VWRLRRHVLLLAALLGAILRALAVVLARTMVGSGPPVIDVFCCS